MKLREIVRTTRVPLILFFSEMVGTALLVAVGVSVVIIDFGAESPVIDLLPDPGVRRLITGFLFGTTGGLIALSHIGKTSGAHINPVVTLAFWLEGKMGSGHALGYALAQLAGGALGALPLLTWGRMGEAIHFGTTVPGAGHGATAAMLGEIATTSALIVGLLFFLGQRRLRRFTPLLFPFLYAAMVYLEAPISGTSTNPARSLGPALVSADWRNWWVYWLGPTIGALLGVGLHRVSWLRYLEIEVAKLSHFDHDPHRVFRRLPTRRRVHFSARDDVLIADATRRRDLLLRRHRLLRPESANGSAQRLHDVRLGLEVGIRGHNRALPDRSAAPDDDLLDMLVSDGCLPCGVAEVPGLGVEPGRRRAVTLSARAVTEGAASGVDLGGLFRRSRWNRRRRLGIRNPKNPLVHHDHRGDNGQSREAEARHVCTHRAMPLS